MTFRIVLLAAFLHLGSWSAPAADGIEWTVDPDFRNKEAALEISGAVCAGPPGTNAWCIAVNDEKKYVQFFSIDGRTIVPGKRARILAKRNPAGGKWGEPDIEAAAYGGGFLYVAGSHGMARKSTMVQPSRFFLYRLPVDPVSGRPRFDVTRDQVVPELERTDGLRALISGDPFLGRFAEQPPDDNGVNIEGLAVRDGRIFVGFRAPVDHDGAVVLAAPFAAIAAGDRAALQTHRLQLGVGYGIRDIVRFGGGFLVLAGAAGDADLEPAIWYWEVGGHAVLVKILRVPPGSKAEGLLLLGTPDDRPVRALVFFDGRENGGPVEFAISPP